MRLLFRLLTFCGLLSLLCLSNTAYSSGMRPETSLVIINADQGEGSINVTNTDKSPALLYVTINNLPDDPSPELFVTQPVVRLEAGQTQRVRFILKTQEPLVVQHLKRVTFEGIPQREVGKSQLSMTLRIDLPVIIHPKGLPVVTTPWEQLRWSMENKHLVVTNPSAYVVRMTQKLTLLPSKKDLILPKTYLLPGERLVVPSALTPEAHKDREVRFNPATRYGYAAQSHTSAITVTP